MNRTGMEENFSFPVLVFACGSCSFPMPEWSSSLYAVFSFLWRHSLHSLQRFCWSSSRWQIATAVFSNAPRRSSSLTNNQAETAIGKPTCDTSWAQSMPRPVRRYPGSGSTVRACSSVFLVKRNSEKNRAKIRNSPFGNPKKIAGHFCLMRACFMR